MTATWDVAIVGAGIIGLTHAREAAKRGLRTIVLERSPFAQGASIRNFGMIWPIGQPPGLCHRIAMRSRDLWLQTASDAGLWCDPCGSIYLATREDELDVLAEFVEHGRPLGYPCELLSAREATSRSPAARADRVIGGMFSPAEVCVDSPRAIPGLARFLAAAHAVEFRFATAVSRIEPGVVITADGAEVHARRIIVAGGADLETLFPDVLAGAGIRRCKLQMLAAEAPPGGWRLGPMIASGLTLRHYDNFAICPSLPALRARVARERPELDRFGIHVMASQHSSGEIVLGDSHEYDAEISPFDRAEIDELILAELRAFIDLPSWRITRRWNGVYAKIPGRPIYTADPLPGVRIVTAPGGSGMTMSFGLAELMWEDWDGFSL